MLYVRRTEEEALYKKSVMQGKYTLLSACVDAIWHQKGPNPPIHHHQSGKQMAVPKDIPAIFVAMLS